MEGLPGPIAEAAGRDGAEYEPGDVVDSKAKSLEVYLTRKVCLCCLSSISRASLPSEICSKQYGWTMWAPEVALKALSKPARVDHFMLTACCVLIS